MTDSIPRYRALGLQIRCDAVNGMSRDEARAVMVRNIERTARAVDGSRRFIGPDTRLIVLPEYFMTGFPFGESIETWRDTAAIGFDGPEYASLAEIAIEHSIFLAANAYETDHSFPELYFQTSFIIGPAGDLVLRYRRLISMFAPTPHDVWDRYLGALRNRRRLSRLPTPSSGAWARSRPRKSCTRRSAALWRCAAPRSSYIRRARAAAPS